MCETVRLKLGHTNAYSGLFYTFLPIGTSNLQNWDGYGIRDLRIDKTNQGMYFDFLTKSCSTLFQNLSDEFPSAYHVEYDVQWVETLISA